MIIEEITKKKSKYEIKVEDKAFLVSDFLILKYHLKKDADLDKDTLASLLNEALKEDAIDKALRYLKSLKTEKQTRNYLLDNKYSEKIVEEVISKLKDNHYIDDEYFASRYLEIKMNEAYGPIYIKNKLEDFGLDAELIEKSLKKYDDEQINLNINIVIKSELKKAKGSVFIIKTHLINKLLAKGFHKEKVKIIVETNGVLLDNINEGLYLRRDFEKALRNYQKKYCGAELKNRIVRYLLARGYNYLDINNFMDEVKL